MGTRVRSIRFSSNRLDRYEACAAAAGQKLNPWFLEACDAYAGGVGVEKKITDSIKTPAEAVFAVKPNKKLIEAASVGLPKEQPPTLPDVSAKKSGRQRDVGAPAGMSDERIAELKEIKGIKPHHIEGEDYRWNGNKLVLLGFGQK